MIIRLTILFLLIGCSKQIGIVDAELTPYVEQFIATEGMSTTPEKLGVDINLGTSAFFESGSVGYCELDSTLFTTHRSILIDKDWWHYYAYEFQKTEIVMHELGHCVFYRKHTLTLLADECPASIMYPYMPEDHCFLNHEKEYDIELLKNFDK